MKIINSKLPLVFLGTFLLFCASQAATAAPARGHMVQFHPISRKDYDAILRLTVGKPIISEARLVSDGIPTLHELRTAISEDLRNGWRQLLRSTWLNATWLHVLDENPPREEAMPLCVIKTVNMEETEDEDDDVPGGSHSYSRVYDAEEDDEIDGRGNAFDDALYGHGDSRRPVVNCVVVMKSKPSEDEYHNGPGHGHGQNNNYHNHYHRRQRRPQWTYSHRSLLGALQLTQTRNLESTRQAIGSDDSLKQTVRSQPEVTGKLSEHSRPSVLVISKDSSNGRAARDPSAFYLQQLLQRFQEEEFYRSYYGYPYPPQYKQYNHNAYPFYGHDQHKDRRYDTHHYYYPPYNGYSTHSPYTSISPYADENPYSYIGYQVGNGRLGERHGHEQDSHEKHDSSEEELE